MMNQPTSSTTTTAASASLKKVHSLDYGPSGVGSGSNIETGSSGPNRNPTLMHSVSIVVELATTTSRASEFDSIEKASPKLVQRVPMTTDQSDLTKSREQEKARAEVGGQMASDTNETVSEDRSRKDVKTDENEEEEEEEKSKEADEADEAVSDLNEEQEDEEEEEEEEEEEIGLESELVKKVLLVDEADKILLARAASCEPTESPQSLLTDDNLLKQRRLSRSKLIGCELDLVESRLKLATKRASLVAAGTCYGNLGSGSLGYGSGTGAGTGTGSELAERGALSRLGMRRNTHHQAAFYERGSLEMHFQGRISAAALVGGQMSTNTSTTLPINQYSQKSSTPAQVDPLDSSVSARWLPEAASVSKVQLARCTTCLSSSPTSAGPSRTSPEEFEFEKFEKQDSAQLQMSQLSNDYHQQFHHHKHQHPPQDHHQQHRQPQQQQQQQQQQQSKFNANQTCLVKANKSLSPISRATNAKFEKFHHHFSSCSSSTTSNTSSSISAAISGQLSPSLHLQQQQQQQQQQHHQHHLQQQQQQQHRRQSLQISLLTGDYHSSLSSNTKSLTEEELRGEREFNEQLRQAKSPDILGGVCGGFGGFRHRSLVVSPSASLHQDRSSSNSSRENSPIAFQRVNLSSKLNKRRVSFGSIDPILVNRLGDQQRNPKSQLAFGTRDRQDSYQPEGGGDSSSTEALVKSPNPARSSRRSCMLLDNKLKRHSLAATNYSPLLSSSTFIATTTTSNSQFDETISSLNENETDNKKTNSKNNSKQIPTSREHFEREKLSLVKEKTAMSCDNTDRLQASSLIINANTRPTSARKQTMNIESLEKKQIPVDDKTGTSGKSDGRLCMENPEEEAMSQKSQTSERKTNTSKGGIEKAQIGSKQATGRPLEKDNSIQSIMANARLRQEEFARLLEEHEQIVNEINRVETKISLASQTSSSSSNLQQQINQDEMTPNK